MTLVEPVFVDNVIKKLERKCVRCNEPLKQVYEGLILFLELNIDAYKCPICGKLEFVENTEATHL